MNQKEIDERIARGRSFAHVQPEEADFRSDQELGRPQPPLFREPVSSEQIPLTMDFSGLAVDSDFLHIVNSRASHRVYTDQKMTLTQLSWLLWCTQGVKSIRGRAYATLRTVPCGGARHEFETYLVLRDVEGVPAGLYHYLPQTHRLECLSHPENLSGLISASLDGQAWAARAQAVFYWSFVCRRAEWRYGIYAHRFALIDAGYISENLYLACTAVGLGGCAIGALEEDACNRAFGLDGQEEFILLAHPVGTVQPRDQQKEADFYAFVKEQNL